MPSRAHSSVTRRTLVAPCRCPSIRGNPRCCAQRPLPSMIIATCRGIFSGQLAIASNFSALKGTLLVVSGQWSVVSGLWAVDSGQWYQGMEAVVSAAHSAN